MPPLHPALWIATVVTLFAAFIYTGPWTTRLIYGGPPAGEWTNVETGPCATTERRFRFGQDVIIHTEQGDVLFASDVLYRPYRTSSGQSIRFKVNDDTGSRRIVRVSYQIAPGKLTPKIFRLDGASRAIDPIPDDLRRRFTFVRCDVQFPDPRDVRRVTGWPER